jgi:hypothetical protein
MSNDSDHLKLAGDWQSVSHTNLEPLLEKLGAPFIIRKIGPRASPSQRISFEGIKMLITTETGFMTKESTIILDGTEFSDEMFQKPFVATATINETGSIHLHGKLGGIDMTVLREINDQGQMVLTTNVDDVVCVRIFGRK